MSIYCLLAKNPKKHFFIKIRNIKILNQVFFISTKKVPKIFTIRPNNLAKKNRKKLLHFCSDYIR